MSTENYPGAIATPAGNLPADFVPLHLENRTHVSTAVLGVHINRKNQTLRGWASAETFPPELRPIRVLGRLCWPVAGIKKLLDVA
jgi:hypothetical protein